MQYNCIKRICKTNLNTSNKNDYYMANSDLQGNSSSHAIFHKR